LCYQDLDIEVFRPEFRHFQYNTTTAYILELWY